MYMRNNTGRKSGYGLNGFPLVLPRLYRDNPSLFRPLEKQLCDNRRLQQNSIIHEAAPFVSLGYIWKKFPIHCRIWSKSVDNPDLLSEQGSHFVSSLQ